MKANQEYRMNESQSKTIDEIRVLRQLRLSEILIKQSKQTDCTKSIENKLLQAMSKFIV